MFKFYFYISFCYNCTGIGGIYMKNQNEIYYKRIQIMHKKQFAIREIEEGAYYLGVFIIKLKKKLVDLTLNFLWQG